MNARLLNVGNQLSSGNNGPGPSSDMSGLDGLSVLTNSNFPFPDTSTNSSSQDALYEASSHIGLSANVSPYASSMMDFSSSQNHQILDTYNTIDANTAANLSCAQSYVSLLQQQPGDVWTGQGNSNGGNFTNKHSVGDCGPQSNQALQQVSGLADSSLHRQAALQKSANHSRMSSVSRGNRMQQYNDNAMMLYDSSGRPNSEHPNEILITLDCNDALQFTNGMDGKHCKEKKLTTTPIPSDAEKSSCSSASSDGISSSEQSPDHLTDDNSRIGGNLSVQHSNQKRDSCSMRSLDTSKSCCYGGVNLVNFGTINFAPVMDSNSIDINPSSHHQDGNVPLPTSDSIVEIADGTSPLENIPLSPNTPTATDSNMSRMFVDAHGIHPTLHGSYAQMQNVSLMNNVHSNDGQQIANSRKPKAGHGESRKPSNNDHSGNANNNEVANVSQNSYHKDFVSLSTVTESRQGERQRKARTGGSKHKHHNALRRGDVPSNGNPTQYGYVNTQCTSTNHLKPKMNADPMLSGRQNFSHVGYSGQTHHNESIPDHLNNAISVRDSHLAVTKFVNQTADMRVPVSNVSNSSQARVWQTVTAVQGKKLPPVLSEQDRIPKRGRPSKKMMQQNLKVKAAQNKPGVTGVNVVKPPQETVPPTSRSSGLVAMYTINDKGVIEEIAPKPKESRRSKERNEAFLKYLDEIKTSSKNQQLADGAKGSAHKDVEKQKKKSRSRNKVFGRQNTQPLTESGITQTMCTFSALAHQFKISHSIVERATENLLKSVAIKRNKELNSAVATQQQKRKQSEKPVAEQQRMSRKSDNTICTNDANRRIAESAFNHCDKQSSSSSSNSVPLSQTAESVKVPTSTDTMDRTVGHLQSTTTIYPVSELTTTSSSLQQQSSIIPILSHSHVVDKAKTAQSNNTNADERDEYPEPSPESPAVPLSPEAADVHLDSSVDDANADDELTRTKHKKKKPKKHKKHKHSDLGAGKKKRRGRDKKKVRKKDKPKSAPTPSASVSLSKSGKIDVDKDVQDSPKIVSSKPSQPTPRQVEHFSTPSSSKNKSREIPSWSVEETAADSGDSSSDDTVVSPKPYDKSSQLFTSSVSSPIFKPQPTFSLHSQSRIGYGTFSMEKSPQRMTIPDKEISPASTLDSTIDNLPDNDSSSFVSQGMLRSNKKHSKYRKKKFSRKSKACDPAFVASVDKLLVPLKNITLDPTVEKASSSDMSRSNVFLTSAVSEAPSSLHLWSTPGKKSTKKDVLNDNAGHKSSSMFPKNCIVPGFGGNKQSKKEEFRLRKSKSVSTPSDSGEGSSISVFCRAAFFQRHGYVAFASQEATVTQTVPGKVAEQTSRTTDSDTVKTGTNTNEAEAGLPKKHPESSKSPIKPASAEKVSEKAASDTIEAVKISRKRGRPPSKANARAKKRKLTRQPPVAPQSESPTSKRTHIDKSQCRADPHRKMSRDNLKSPKVRKPQKPKKALKEKESDKVKEPVVEPETSKPIASTDLVSDTLLQQIKLAIEASLPKHPSVNKEAITKSVDAAVQSYLQTISDAQPSPPPTEKQQDVLQEKEDNSSDVDDDPSIKTSETSPKNNSDIHPKKLWACKHQDTETSSNSKDSSPSVVSTIAKRGRGRPRKYPVTSSKSKAIGVAKSRLLADKNPGKVPTTSATVVPSKRKVLTVKIRGKCVKPAAKGVLPRIKSRPTSKNVVAFPRSVNSTVTNQAALSCLSALCSVKAAKVLAKSTDKSEDSRISMYPGSDVEKHITETIDRTVEMYSWDNYSKFQESCMEVANELGVYDDVDFLNGDTKSKTPVIKKSIESVVEKLKNKQAQTEHSDAANVFNVHKPSPSENIIVGDKRSLDNGIHRRPGRCQDMYEKVSSFKEDSAQSSKLHKVKHSAPAGKTKGGGVSLKRGRGRSRMHSPSANGPYLKKRRLSEFEAQKSGKKSTGKSIFKDNTRPCKEMMKYQSKLSTSLSGRKEKDRPPSPHKKYLNAGLYSSTFKQTSSERSISIANDDISTLLTERWPRLPPPIDAGLHVRAQINDFQLPYKIWWMYKHEEIMVSQDPSNNYLRITENVVTDPKTLAVSADHICSCSAENRDCCGQNCLNRMMYVECDAATCPHGLRCSNREIQKGKWCESLQQYMTENRGWGIRTLKSIAKGSFILEYVGEVVSETEFRKRSVELYHAYDNHYCVQLDSTSVIDGYRIGNIGRFVNHSCEPNCEMQKWCVDGEYRIGLFAHRQIHPNEELTYDYNLYAYNMDIRQCCRCGSQKCRGFMGDRAQRAISSDSDSSVNSLTSNATPRLRKQSKLKAFKVKDDVTTVKDFSTLQMKPIPKKEREMIRSKQLFLLRNLTQVRRKEEEEHRKKSESSVTKPDNKAKPRKSHQSKEDKKKVESALTEMYTAIATCKDQNGVSVAIPFMNLPSKKKNPEYYERISDPIDLSIIEHNIVSNHYKDIETFNNDVQRVFKNAEKYHGKKSTLGKDVFRLRKAYAHARGAAMLLLNGLKKPAKLSEVSDVDDTNENIHRKNEDHIRCICQIYRDEGLMVQCEKCYVWQHCDCIGVDPDKTEHYICEECDPRPVPVEVKVIPPPPNTPPGHTYYLTLLRDDLLVKQGDCVYLMKDHRLSHNSPSSTLRASYRNASSVSHEKSKIFRVEQLWTDERGDKYGYGYYFLRPHETHHAPSRTFYHNELFVSPFYEIIPLEAVIDLCCVMDQYTYCKGKPKAFKMCDLYICDFRIDKAASSFNRVTKKKYPICTKPHVFDTYKKKLTPKKDYQPHKVPEQYRRSLGRPPSVNESLTQGVSDEFDVNDVSEKNYRNLEHNNCTIKKRDLGSAAWRKRQRLDGIANKLLSKLPSKGEDVSYLLGSVSGKHRKKSSSGRQ